MHRHADACATGALAGLGPWFGGVFGSGLQTLNGGLEDYNNDVANAVYHGGTVTVIERVKNFNLTANYTYSHTIDNGNFTTFINLPVNQFDYKAERANSNQDARHRLVTNFTATGPEDTFVRHFTLSSIITLQSGRPFTIFYGNNTLNDVAGGATDRVGGPLVRATAPDVSNCATMIATKYVHRRSAVLLGLPPRAVLPAHRADQDGPQRRCFQPAQPIERG